MRETWLRPNARALAVGLLPPLAVLALAVALIVLGSWVWKALGACLLVLASGAIAMLVIQMRLPRLGYQDGFLLVYLRGLEPFRVPVEQVEVFFLGQTDSKLPKRRGVSGASGDEESSSVVVRIAERAEEWKHRDVRTSLGHWCDGYITIRGTWCEPLTPDLLMQLNNRLVDIHKQRRDAS